MTISIKPEDIDNPEVLLYYMESHPHSGENRAAAKLIRLLLSTSAPLVAVTAPILNSQLKIIASLLGAAISDAEPSELRDVCIRVKNDLLSVIAHQSSPLSDTNVGDMQQANDSDIIAMTQQEFDEFEGWWLTVPVHEEIIINMKHVRMAWLAGRVAGQVAPQAIVEPLTDALLKLLRYAEIQICQHDETHRGGAIWEICDQCGAKWANDEGRKPEFKWPKSIEDARAILATPPTSKADTQKCTDGGNCGAGGYCSNCKTDTGEVLRAIENAISLLKVGIADSPHSELRDICIIVKHDLSKALKSATPSTIKEGGQE